MRDKTRHLRGLAGKTLLVWLVVILVVAGLMGCLVGQPAATEPARTPASAAIEPELAPTPEPEPFSCEGGGAEEKLVCTAESLEDEFGERVEVIVAVPWQGYDVQVERRPLSPEDRTRLMSASEPFQVARLIISFEIVDPETGKIIGEFDPPFELQVGYTPKHWESAVEGGASHPRLAFWDFEPPEKDQQWIEFTVEKHNFRVEGDDQGGFLVATISNWGDPAYGAGP